MLDLTKLIHSTLHVGRIVPTREPKFSRGRTSEFFSDSYIFQTIPGRNYPEGIFRQGGNFLQRFFRGGEGNFSVEILQRRELSGIDFNNTNLYYFLFDCSIIYVGRVVQGSCLWEIFRGTTLKFLFHFNNFCAESQNQTSINSKTFRN